MKRLRLLLALPIFFTFIATNNSISHAAKLEKIEKTYSVKQKEILSVSLNIDAGKINVHKNGQPDKIFISILMREKMSFISQLIEIDGLNRGMIIALHN